MAEEKKVLDINKVFQTIEYVCGEAPVKFKLHQEAAESIAGLKDFYINASKEVSDLKQENESLKAKVQELETLVKANEAQLKKA